jgi:hypothetical protein
MERSPGTYASSGTPVMVKEYRAALAAALRHEGITLDVFIKANNKMAFLVGQSTLFAHMKALDEGEAPLSVEKGSGHPLKLGEEQWAVIAGAILMEPKKMDLQWVATWVKDNMDMDVSLATVSRWLDLLELLF